MIDSFDKLVNICLENNLGAETIDYFIDIKRELEEKEKLEKTLYKAHYDLMYFKERVYLLEKNISELAACYCIEPITISEKTLEEIYDRLDIHFDIKDR